MGIQDIIEGKKQWRAHMARVKALPPDYQIVYKEMQKYLFKVGPINLPDGPLLPGIVDFCEEASPRARESWNSSAPTSPRSATTWSRTLPPMRTSTRNPSAGNRARTRGNARHPMPAGVEMSPVLGSVPGSSACGND